MNHPMHRETKSLPKTAKTGDEHFHTPGVHISWSWRMTQPALNMLCGKDDGFAGGHKRLMRSGGEYNRR